MEVNVQGTINQFSAHVPAYVRTIFINNDKAKMSVDNKGQVCLYFHWQENKFEVI